MYHQMVFLSAKFLNGQEGFYGLSACVCVPTLGSVGEKKSYNGFKIIATSALSILRRSTSFSDAYVRQRECDCATSPREV